MLNLPEIVSQSEIDEFFRTISHNVKRLRKQSGLSQLEVYPSGSARWAFTRASKTTSTASISTYCTFSNSRVFLKCKYVNFSGKSSRTSR